MTPEIDKSLVTGEEDDRGHTINVTRVTLPISLTLSIIGSVITSVVIVIVSYFRLESSIMREINQASRESREYTDVKTDSNRQKIDQQSEPPGWLTNQLNDLNESIRELRTEVRELRHDQNHPPG